MLQHLLDKQRAERRGRLPVGAPRDDVRRAGVPFHADEILDVEVFGDAFDALLQRLPVLPQMRDDVVLPVCLDCCQERAQSAHLRPVRCGHQKDPFRAFLGDAAALHDLAPADQRRDGKAVGHSLPEGGQIRFHVKVLLASA